MAAVAPVLSRPTSLNGLAQRWGSRYEQPSNRLNAVMVDCSFGCAQPSDFAPSHRRHWTGSLVQISGSPHRVERSERMAATRGSVVTTDQKPRKRYAEAGEMTETA